MDRGAWQACSPWGYRVRHDWACMQWNGNKTILSCHLVAVRQKKKNQDKSKDHLGHCIHPSQTSGGKRGVFLFPRVFGVSSGGWRSSIRDRRGATAPSTAFNSVQSLSRVQLFATPRTAERQASRSITNSRSLLKLMSIKSTVLPSCNADT